MSQSNLPNLPLRLHPNFHLLTQKEDATDELGTDGERDSELGVSSSFAHLSFMVNSTDNSSSSSSSSSPLSPNSSLSSSSPVDGSPTDAMGKGKGKSHPRGKSKAKRLENKENEPPLIYGQEPRKGRGQGWVNTHIDILLDIIDERRPLGAYHWEDVGALFNARTGLNDSLVRIKAKFLNLATSRKPTGVHTKPTQVARAQEIYAELEKEASMKEVSGSWEEYDDEECVPVGDGEESDVITSPETVRVPSSPYYSSSSSASSASYTSSTSSTATVVSPVRRSPGLIRTDSFPTRNSTSAKKMRPLVDGGEIGEVVQSFSSSLRSVIEVQAQMHREEMRELRERLERQEERAREAAERQEERAREAAERQQQQMMEFIAVLHRRGGEGYER